MKKLKRYKNKIIIFLVFLLVIAIFFVIFTKKNYNNHIITEVEARNKIINALSDENIEKVESQSLVITKNDNYMIMVVGDQYILTDFSTSPPNIFQFKSNKPDIKVKVLEIKEDGYLVEHDDHTHFIYGNLNEKIKVGDYIFIKDPHTYLQNQNHNESIDKHLQ